MTGHSASVLALTSIVDKVFTHAPLCAPRVLSPLVGGLFELHSSLYACEPAPDFAALTAS